jgi:hypothetical protein
VCDNLKTPVPKKTKNQTPDTIAPNEAVSAPPTVMESSARPASKHATKTKSASKKSAPKKRPVQKTAKAAKSAAAKSKSNPAEIEEPSDADVRLRAYFIAERRVQLALQGDPALDWIEARQQLIDEARRAQS